VNCHHDECRDFDPSGETCLLDEESRYDLQRQFFNNALGPY
jgi:hypothetical protein